MITSVVEVEFALFLYTKVKPTQPGIVPIFRCSIVYFFQNDRNMHLCYPDTRLYFTWDLFLSPRKKLKVQSTQPRIGTIFRYSIAYFFQND